MSSNKKAEEINLYISAITNRDPSKRQIKPVDKEAFQLFDDFDSGSDEDFVFNSDEESDENDDIKEEESDIENNDENDGNDEEEKNTDTDNVVEDDVVNYSENLPDEGMSKTPIFTKCKLDTVMICMMCLLDSTYADNEIIECDGCGVVVHEDCYKICDNVFMSCDNSDASTDPWFCDACLNNVQNPRCELCPVEGGVFKRTENNRWVHLQCALYTPGVAFNDVECLTEVTLSELPLKEWSNRECCICTNPFYAKTGICISCDAGLCKNFFHVLCAQKEGLLSEPNVEENPEDPYFAQCQQHTDKEVAKRRRKNWSAAVNRQKLRMENWRNGAHFSDSRLLRKLDYFSELYRKVKECVPSPFVPSTKVPCYLETNPVAVFMFKKKATNLRLSREVLNIRMHSNDTRICTGAPVFSPDFIAYFLDREKKIDELSMEVVRLRSLHRDMQISEQNASHQFNKVTAKKEATIVRYKVVRERLRDISFIVDNALPELTEQLDRILAQFPLISCDSEGVSHSNEEGSNDSTRRVVNINNGNSNTGNGVVAKESPVINECWKCKSMSDQHLMIDCDDCIHFFHLHCLEPPLTRMPRKTKLYGWQCANCARSSSDSDGLKQNIDINKPRQLRRMSGICSRFKRSDNVTSSMNAKKRLLRNSKEIANKKARISSTLSITDKRNLIKTDSAEISTMQRKSFRSKKRPMTLRGEFETFEFKRRSRHSQV